MFSAIRYAGHYNLVMPLLLATPLCAQFPILRLTRQIESQPQFFVLLAKAARRTLYPLYAAIVLIPFVAGAFGKGVTPDPQITPAAAVDYIVDHNDGGKVYNSFNFGGYLTFRKVPTLSMDEPTSFFSTGFSQRINTTTKHPRKVIQYLEEYNTKFVLLVEPESFESQELQATAGWRKVYSDEFSALFEREP